MPQVLPAAFLKEVGMQHTIKVIAHIKNDLTGKFGIPRQSGILNELTSVIVFEPEFRNETALRGIEGFSHLWLIWQFSESVRDEWSPTVRPPRLGGNKRVGVFATRSPFRPNPLGLSAVKLEAIEKTEKYGTVLVVSGADLMNGTPIYDIKPYLPLSDYIQNATSGFTEQIVKEPLDVDFSDELLAKIPKEKRTTLKKILANDPRPSYQDDDERIYGFSFADFEIKFCVKDQNNLIVLDVQNAKYS